jgi:hypothetical protein
MSCTWEDQRLCHIFKTYCGSGDPNYHGELCTGCLWWHDSPDDIAFKERAKAIAEGRDHVESHKERVGPRLARKPWLNRYSREEEDES